MLNYAICGGDHTIEKCQYTSNTQHEKVSYLGRQNDYSHGRQNFYNDNSNRSGFHTHPSLGYSWPSNRPPQQKPSLYGCTTKLEHTLHKIHASLCIQSKKDKCFIKKFGDLDGAIG